MTPKVVYWNNQPTPYNVARFNAVVARGGIDLRVWFSGMREADRSWDVRPQDWKFAAVVRSVEAPRESPLRWVVGRLEYERPDLFITNYDRADQVLGGLAALSLARRTAVRSLPQFEAWTKRSLLRDSVWHLFFRSIDGSKVPGRDGRLFARRYGLDEDRSWSVVQSVDVEHYSQALEVSADIREKRRAALGLGEGCVFLYAGRMWEGKGVSELLAAFRLVRRELPGSTLLMVGDGPDEATFRRESADLVDVFWYGFCQPVDLPDVYALADVFVFPTRGDPNGLVVEEAMAAGLPVISTDAAGDISERVLDGRTGFVVESGSVMAMADRMLELGHNPAVRREMGKAAVQTVAKMAPSAYAESFGQFVDAVLERSPCRGPVRTAGEIIGRGVRVWARTRRRAS